MLFEVLSSSTLPLSLLSIFIASILSSASGRLLVSIFCSFFSGILFCCFIWEIFLWLLILAASLYLFCVLDRAAMSVGLDRVAWCSRCPVGSSGTASAFTLAGHCSWVLITVGMSMGGIYPHADWLQGLSLTTVEDQLFRGSPHGAGLILASSGAF